MKACVDTFAAGLNDLTRFLANSEREGELVKRLREGAPILADK